MHRDVHSTDPARQKAGVRVREVRGRPYGASVVVPGTGYVPNNELAAKDERYLADFYKENPLFRAGLDQMPLMMPWYSFPGNNGVKVTQTIVDNLRDARGAEVDAGRDAEDDDWRGAEAVAALIASSGRFSCA